MSCDNPKCVGGWVEVDPVAYAEARWPIPEGATDEQVASIEYKRAHYAGAVRPCSDCRPEQFTRWANGCFGPEHRASKCDLCLEALGEKAAAGHDRGARA